MTHPNREEVRHACWTCRSKSWVEISHSSQADTGTLFRCAECKAIYPRSALSTPPQAEPAAIDVSKEAALSASRKINNWVSEAVRSQAEPADVREALCEHNLG